MRGGLERAAVYHPVCHQAALTGFHITAVLLVAHEAFFRKHYEMLNNTMSITKLAHELS